MTANDQERDFRAASGLASWQADPTQLGDPGQVPAYGPGLFEITKASGERLVTNVRRLAGAERRPGSVLVAVAAWLLTLIGGGALYVSFAAQRQYVFDARRQNAASIIEALLLDALMIVFTLLALGLSRAGKPSRTERFLIVACAAASAYMNASAADTASPRSVVAYTVAPVALAVVADRVIAVIRRHVPGDAGPSAWTVLGHALRAGARLTGLVALYVLRLALDPAPTAKGLRRAVLNAAPLPAAPPPEARVIPPPPPDITGGSKKARLLALYRQHPGYGDRSLVSRLAAELGPKAGLQPGTARTYLYAETDRTRS